MDPTEYRRRDREAKRREYDREPEPIYKRALGYRRRNPARTRAWDAVYRALKSGRLIRPERCARCGGLGEPTRDGRASIEAHHPDYSKPLEVEWLCRGCHVGDRLAA
jgi:hypothetical protein